MAEITVTTTMPDTTFSFSTKTVLEIWELCLLASEGRERDSEAGVTRHLAEHLQKIIGLNVQQQALSVGNIYPIRAQADEAVKQRKRQYRADKAYQEMEEVYKPLMAELNKYKEGKGKSSNKATRKVLKSFEKELDNAAKKAKEIGKKRKLEDSEDEGGNGIVTPAKKSMSKKTTVADGPSNVPPIFPPKAKNFSRHAALAAQSKTSAFYEAGLISDEEFSDADSPATSRRY